MLSLLTIPVLCNGHVHGLVKSYQIENHKIENVLVEFIFFKFADKIYTIYFTFIVHFWQMNTSKNCQTLETHVSSQIKCFIDESAEVNDVLEEFQLNSHIVNCKSMQSFTKVLFQTF